MLRRKGSYIYQYLIGTMKPWGYCEPGQKLQVFDPANFASENILA